MKASGSVGRVRLLDVDLSIVAYVESAVSVRTRQFRKAGPNVA